MPFIRSNFFTDLFCKLDPGKLLHLLTIKNKNYYNCSHMNVKNLWVMLYRNVWHFKLNFIECLINACDCQEMAVVAGMAIIQIQINKGLHNNSYYNKNSYNRSKSRAHIRTSVRVSFIYSLPSDIKSRRWMNLDMLIYLLTYFSEVKKKLFWCKNWSGYHQNQLSISTFIMLHGVYHLICTQISYRSKLVFGLG